jgi:hypothetical protein
VVISSKQENVLTTMHAATERGQLNRFIHSNLKEGKIIMLLVVEVAAFCSGAVEQVNKNLERSCKYYDTTLAFEFSNQDMTSN